VVAQGSPQEVLSEKTLTRWYQAELKVFSHPEHPTPQIWLQR